MSVALVDGSRIDDCELVSAGHQGVQSLWLYTNGADTFVPLADLTDLWEVLPPSPGRAALTRIGGSGGRLVVDHHQPFLAPVYVTTTSRRPAG